MLNQIQPVRRQRTRLKMLEIALTVVRVSKALMKVQTIQIQVVKLLPYSPAKPMALGSTGHIGEVLFQTALVPKLA